MTLKATRFHGTGVSHRVVLQDDVKASLNSNLAYVSGTLLSVIIETGVKGNAYVKFFSGYLPSIGSTNPHLIFRGSPGTTEVYELPDGFAFTNLHMWATKNANPLDTIDPPSKTKVTLLLG